jgi:hypothetical protein
MKSFLKFWTVEVFKNDIFFWKSRFTKLNSKSSFYNFFYSLHNLDVHFLWYSRPPIFLSFISFALFAILARDIKNNSNC